MKYIKNNGKTQETEFCCPSCLAEELIDALQFTREYEGIDLIAKADVITEVLRTLLSVEIDDKVFNVGVIELDGGEYDYAGEYTLTINDDYTIWIEPSWREINGEMKLLNTEAYITYLSGDCDSKILQKLEKDDHNVMIFNFDED